MAKYAFVTGGVVSSVGKTVAAATLASLLQARGYSVSVKKLDPYLNFDAGMIASSKHGEVFVTDDGCEVDLDLGYYERFTGRPTSAANSITSGRIYQNIITKERRGDYDGDAVQVVPHVTDEIKDFILEGCREYDFIICEVGGTVGDIEVMPFIECIRQIRNELPKTDVVCIHVTMAPYISATDEYKTKPTQHSVKELQALGISPDVLVVRSDKKIEYKDRQKLAAFCNVHESAVIEALDVSSIYHAPLTYHRAGFDEAVLSAFSISPTPQLRADTWKDVIYRTLNPRMSVDIAVIGKPALNDTYRSIHEALQHGGIASRVAVNIKWVDPEEIEKHGVHILSDADGILMPGGFGTKGINGKLSAVKYAREKNIPFFGVCFGLQFACLEALKTNGMPEATSEEFGSGGVLAIQSISKVDAIYEHKDDGKRPPLRIGATKITLNPESKIAQAYDAIHISERHRHRFTVNNDYVTALRDAGLTVAGRTADGKFIEAVESDDHPWFVAVQYHPELKSSPFNPHPLFKGFIQASEISSKLNMSLTLK